MGGQHSKALNGPMQPKTVNTGRRETEKLFRTPFFILRTMPFAQENPARRVRPAMPDEIKLGERTTDRSKTEVVASGLVFYKLRVQLLMVAFCALAVDNCRQINPAPSLKVHTGGQNLPLSEHDNQFRLRCVKSVLSCRKERMHSSNACVQK